MKLPKSEAGGIEEHARHMFQLESLRQCQGAPAQPQSVSRTEALDDVALGWVKEKGDWP
jgi:hypothetical protein